MTNKTSVLEGLGERHPGLTEPVSDREPHHYRTSGGERCSAARYHSRITHSGTAFTGAPLRKRAIPE